MGRDFLIFEFMEFIIKPYKETEFKSELRNMMAQNQIDEGREVMRIDRRCSDTVISVNDGIINKLNSAQLAILKAVK
jgi:hypothetical protein